MNVTRPAWILLLVAGCAVPTPSVEPEPTTTVDQTGILVVDVGERVQAGPFTKDIADAYEAAAALVEANGSDLGYVWLDPSNGELVLSVVTPRGRELVEAAGIGVPIRTRDVAHGAAELQRIQDDATFLHSRGVEGADLIVATLPDHRDNRALLVLSAMSRPLLDYLAAQYPADAIAVQVDPDGAAVGGP